MNRRSFLSSVVGIIAAPLAASRAIADGALNTAISTGWVPIGGRFEPTIVYWSSVGDPVSLEV